ncbi:P-loop containing nucleoside triphosphate hydrolase [Glarea lozoyensis ATCC 20868]|uniref:p-loop containing nucleoside triphosphate hydrolase n=1 Tax=Glarea lozoyensis (strain ATCC 20868 / MF5171) TaxID=1116229 RepID=S3CIK4_GLAL2|nr:P-loop containing nucleoside triphosphate hydrolase [Glarea lozoyensis ATCC 20868]EPE26297.1 P-loop containing nucleoside triphosphate hydrolase [Glarea lozoyensis ATCC 20868]
MSPRATTDIQETIPLIFSNGVEMSDNDGKKEIVQPFNSGFESAKPAESREATSDNDESNPHGIVQASALDENSENYVTQLKKRLDSIEKELRSVKNSRRGDSGEIGREKRDTSSPEKEKEDAELQKRQKVEITRVPADQWRNVKTEGKLDPKLSVLIVSSKRTVKIARRRKDNDQKMGESAAQDIRSAEFSPVETPYRLAINSTYLLKVLGQCTDTNFPTEQNVLVRPFKHLVAYESEIRESLKEVETICDQAEARLNQHVGNSTSGRNVENAPMTANVPAGEELTDANAKDENTLEEKAREARRNRDELRCLVEFMDKDMSDIFDIKLAASTHTLEEVAFEHLWQVYKPGIVIYGSNQRGDPNRCQAYHVLHVTGGRVCFDNGIKSSFHAVNNRQWESESEGDEQCCDTVKSTVLDRTTFIIDCYLLDFDGYRIGPKPKRFAILPYTGKRSVLSFAVYPSEYDPKNEDIRKKLIERGNRFTSLVLGAHKKYSGMTLREANQVTKSINRLANYVIADVEVKSEVMIDQASGVEHFKKKFYKWQIKFGGSIINRSTDADRREVFDALPRIKNQPWITDVFDDSNFEEDRRSEFLRSTDELAFRLLRDSPLPDNFLTLLPPRVYGYAMLHHKWFPLDINLIEDITEVQSQRIRSGLENLVLPKGHRMLLQALIKNQVGTPKKTSGNSDDEMDEFSMDVVKGKGKGLIILLHGVPGVGKTSTAECVAAQLRRPLLPITCGDIGTTASTAQVTLEYFCELAHRWRCVLLLDEADVFLAKREKGDIERNSLVSVFLRVLEYYSGVIILTTNRVGEFDEAFRSRIHISLYYPRLDRPSTKQVWERNISRLRQSGLDIDIEEDRIRKFYERHWAENIEHPSRRWNGRQIKNAFQTALALANWDFHDAQESLRLERPLLKAAHFDRVAETSAHFDDYISDIHGLKEEDTYGILAEREEVRKDTNQGIYPRSRVPAGGSRKQAPLHRRGGRTYSYDDFDDASPDEDDLESRARKVPTAHRGSRIRGDYGDEEEDYTGTRSRSNVKSRRGAGRTRDHDEDEIVEGDDLDDVQRLELELKLARLKRRKGSSHGSEIEGKDEELNY